MQSSLPTAADECCGTLAEPRRPLPEECCGNGCTSCVYDIYEQEKRIYLRSLERRKNTNALSELGSRVLSPDDYSPFVVTRIEDHTTDTYVIAFKAIASAFGVAIGLGQHLILRGVIDGVSVTRPYTPISCAADDGRFEVLIKVYADGLMSSLVRSWSVGTIVEWRGPIGHWVYLPKLAPKLLVLAAGTGIAPFVRLVDSILDDDADETRIRLLYGCKSLKSVLLRSRINEWKKYWNFTARFFLSQESLVDDRLPYGVDAIEGRITKEAVGAEIATASGVQPPLILICGSTAFAASMRTYASELGVGSTMVHAF